MLQASQKRTKRAPFSGERPPAGAYEDQFEGTAGPNDGLHRDLLKVMLSIYNEPTVGRQADCRAPANGSASSLMDDALSFHSTGGRREPTTSYPSGIGKGCGGGGSDVKLITRNVIVLASQQMWGTTQRCRFTGQTDAIPARWG